MSDHPQSGSLAQSVLRPALAWIIIVVFASLACAWSMRDILTAPMDSYPAGIDVLGHLTKGLLFASKWRSGTFTDWCPEWYMGATMSQYYPPLSNWLCGILQLVTDNVLVVFEIFTFGCLLLAAIATARLFKRLGGHLPGALVAAILFATANYNLFTALVDGTLGRTLSMPLYPLLVHSLANLSDNPSKRNWLVSVGLVLGLVLTHAMHAYLLFVTAAFFMLMYSLRHKDWWKRVLGLIEVAVVGVVLSGFWSIPGVTHLENRLIPFSPPGLVSQRTMGIGELLRPGGEKASLVLFGAAFTAIGINLAKRETRIHVFCYVAGILVPVSLMYGFQNPLYRFLPMHTEIMPLRFANAALLPAALAAGLLADMLSASVLRRFNRGGQLRGAVVQVAVALALIGLAFWTDGSPAVGRPTRYDSFVGLINQIPRGGSGPFSSGRIAEELPSMGGESAYLPVQAGFNIIAGWNIEGTVHEFTFYDHNVAYSDGSYEYILRNWYLWNARSALIDTRYEGMIGLLTSNGWTMLDRQGSVALLTLPKEPTYIMRYQPDTIVVGRSSFYLARLFPWVVQGRLEDPLEYEEDYLNLFATIILYDIPPTDIPALERRVIDWVKKGKTVVVDLSGSTSIGEFLGVRVKQVTFSGEVTFSVTDDTTRLTDVVRLNEGSGAVYSGLDQDLLTTVVDGEHVVISGTRELQWGEVRFVGGHLPRLVSDTDHDRAQGLLQSYLSSGRSPKLQMPEPMEVDREVWDDSGVGFEYTSAQDTPVIVSVTYTPRWRATIDGVSQTLYSHENLVFTVLPSGHHSVQIRYEGTWVTSLGWGASLLALAYVLLRLLGPARFRLDESSRGKEVSNGHLDSPHVQ